MLNAESRRRKCLESFLGNRLAAAFANPVGSAFDAIQGIINFQKLLRFIPCDIQGSFQVETVGAGFRKTGQIQTIIATVSASGYFFNIADIPEESLPFLEQLLFEFL